MSLENTTWFTTFGEQPSPDNGRTPTRPITKPHVLGISFSLKMRFAPLPLPTHIESLSVLHVLIPLQA